MYIKSMEEFLLERKNFSASGEDTGIRIPYSVAIYFAESAGISRNEINAHFSRINEDTAKETAEEIVDAAKEKAKDPEKRSAWDFVGKLIDRLKDFLGKIKSRFVELTSENFLNIFKKLFKPFVERYADNVRTHLFKGDDEKLKEKIQSEMKSFKELVTFTKNKLASSIGTMIENFMTKLFSASAKKSEMKESQALFNLLAEERIDEAGFFGLEKYIGVAVDLLITKIIKTVAKNNTQVDSLMKEYENLKLIPTRLAAALIEHGIEGFARLMQKFGYEGAADFEVMSKISAICIEGCFYKGYYDAQHGVRDLQAVMTKAAIELTAKGLSLLKFAGPFGALAETAARASVAVMLTMAVASELLGVEMEW